MKKTAIFTGFIIAALSIAGCTQYTCAPIKTYSEPWVQLDKSFGTGEACMTSIWDVGVCAANTQEVADVQIKWALECVVYCKKALKEKAIKSCRGISMDRSHGRPLCKRVTPSAEMPALQNPWYIICSDISSSCECLPMKSKKH